MEAIIQILLYQLFFIVVYQLIKKESFFQLNRFYLLVSLVLSFVLPFVDWSFVAWNVSSSTYEQINTIYLPEVFIGTESVEAKRSVLDFKESPFTFLQALEHIYIVGFAVAFSLFYVRIESLMKFINSHLGKNTNDYILIRLKESIGAFSFLNYIVIEDDMPDNEQTIVIAHEAVHVRQKHSYDNLFLGVLQVVMWFNPLLFWYKKELQLVHEYQADAKACEKINLRTYYSQLLQINFTQTPTNLVSSFYNVSQLKNRIIMLQKPKQSARRIFKYVVLTPIMILFIGLSIQAQEQLPQDELELFEKYRMQMRVKFEEENLNEDDIEKIFDFEKDENGKLTKDSFYRLKAIFELSEEDYLGKYKIIGYNLNTNYESYLNNDDDFNVLVVFSSKNKNDSISLDQQEVSNQNDTDFIVPFASVHQVPTFPGCEEFEDNEGLKQCMSSKIQDHIAANFDTKKANKASVPGVNRVYVRFTIDEEGVVRDIDARSIHPDVSEEGKKAVASLPKMKPGLNKNNEAVSVVYTLPITFKVPEEEKEE